MTFPSLSKAGGWTPAVNRTVLRLNDLWSEGEISRDFISEDNLDFEAHEGL